MIDFAHIEKYQENNRIEAKKALGGLPNSIWETYSAFANTFGGIILLGVEEYRDKSFHPVNLPNPELLIEEFWDIINDASKVSVNILSDKDVTIEKVNGNRMIAIRVPRAQRFDKPVFIDGNLMSGSYRRNGEGDYRCTREEVLAMVRDASRNTSDMRILEETALTALDFDSIKRYRSCMEACRPGNAREEYENEEFLCKLGAAGRGKDGRLHPTEAGLFLFGRETEIVKECPGYFLDYQEQLGTEESWTERLVSSSGDWSGNVYDFYVKVCERLTKPPEGEADAFLEEPSVQEVLREALINCLSNADYYGKQGITIIKKKESICFSNPGGFRIDIETAKRGGVSDPRNSALIKIFHQIDIGEGAGSGIPNMFTVWKKQGWNAPTIYESFEPERITLVLEFVKSSEKNAETKDDDTIMKHEVHKQAIMEYLTENISAGSAEIAELLGLKPAKARAMLSELVEAGAVVVKEYDNHRIYKLNGES